jgi:NitT/TauT family transport system permease protein
MQRSFRIVDMYAWLVLLALLGYALNAVFVALERRFVVW